MSEATIPSSFPKVEHVVRAEEITSRLKGVKKRGPDRWQAICPLHADKNPSLSIERKNGKVLTYCHSCGKGTYAKLLNHLGLWKWEKGERRMDATYAYRDQDRNLVFEVLRYSGKVFRQRRPDGRGGRVWNLDGVQLVPFKLPELLSAINPPAREDFTLPQPRPVHIVEGEADVIAMNNHGFATTCNPGGAGKWKEDFNRWFRGAHEANVIADKDSPGRKHAREVAISLRQTFPEMSVRVLEVPGDGKDVRDFFDAGGTADQLEKHIRHQALFDPKQASRDNESERDNGTQSTGTLRNGSYYDATRAVQSDRRITKRVRDLARRSISSSGKWFRQVWKAAQNSRAFHESDAQLFFVAWHREMKRRGYLDLKVSRERYRKEFDRARARSIVDETSTSAQAIWDSSLKNPFPPEAQGLSENARTIVRFACHLGRVSTERIVPGGRRLFYFSGEEIENLSGGKILQRTAYRAIKEAQDAGVFRVMRDYVKNRRSRRFAYFRKGELSPRPQRQLAARVTEREISK